MTYPNYFFQTTKTILLALALACIIVPAQVSADTSLTESGSQSISLPGVADTTLAGFEFVFNTAIAGLEAAKRGTQVARTVIRNGDARLKRLGRKIVKRLKKTRKKLNKNRKLLRRTIKKAVSLAAANRDVPASLGLRAARLTGKIFNLQQAALQLELEAIQLRSELGLL